VTVEEIVDGNLMHDLKMKAGTIPGLYISGITEANRGAWPLGIPGGYNADHEHLRRYVDLAKTDKGFQQYMEEFILEASSEAAE
jgi:glutaconate CoA-transferase subunit A